MRNSIYSNCSQLDYVRKLFPKVHITSNGCLKLEVDITSITETDLTDHLITIKPMDINLDYITEMDNENNQEATTSEINGTNTININVNNTPIKLVEWLKHCFRMHYIINHNHAHIIGSINLF